MRFLQDAIGKKFRIKLLKSNNRYGNKSTNNDMYKYRFKVATITEVVLPGNIDKTAIEAGLEADKDITDKFVTYRIDLDNGHWAWTKEMFMFGKLRLKNLEKKMKVNENYVIGKIHEKDGKVKIYKHYMGADGKLSNGELIKIEESNVK